MLRGTCECSVPNSSQNCCTDLSSPCWCKTLMQPGPAVCSQCYSSCVDLVLHLQETQWSSAGQPREQGLAGCLAVVALCCTLRFGHSLCQLSSRFKTQAPTDVAEPESVCNRGSGERNRCGDEERFYPSR